MADAASAPRPDAAPADAMAAAGRLVWFLVAFNAAGFLSLISHTANLFVPSLAVAWLMLAPGRLFSAVSVDRLLVLALLLIAVFASAIFGANGGLRAFGFAAFSFLPLLGLALVPAAAIEKALIAYSVIAAAGMILWTLILHVFLGGQLGPWGSWTPAGTANLYGVHFNMIWPTLLFGAGKAGTREQGLALRALAVICFVLAILTFSRAAIFSATLSFLIIAVRSRRHLTLAAIVFAGLVLSFFYTEALYQTLAQLRIVNFTPDLGRFKIWSLAWDLSQENLLFGIGPGGAAAALEQIQVYHAHNNVLNTLLESGLPAALLFALFHLALFVLAAKAILKGGGGTYLGCGILAWLASGMVGTTITNPELTLTLILISGACGVCLREKPR
jgi:O-antigen ligase